MAPECKADGGIDVYISNAKESGDDELHGRMSFNFPLESSPRGLTMDQRSQRRRRTICVRKGPYNLVNKVKEPCKTAVDQNRTAMRGLSRFILDWNIMEPIGWEVFNEVY